MNEKPVIYECTLNIPYVPGRLAKCKANKIHYIYKANSQTLILMSDDKEKLQKFCDELDPGHEHECTVRTR